MDLELRDRVVLVTGGTGAIGATISQVFADEKADVAIGWHSNKAAAEELAASLGLGGTATCCVRLDLEDPASIADAIETVKARLGTISVLVANAVVWPGAGETLESLNRCLTANVTGRWRWPKRCCPACASRNGGVSS